jgi:hypothetical protein
VLTGYKYAGAQSRQISPTDWPYLGSVVKLLKPSKRLPAYSTVWLPDVMRLNDNVQPAGQTAGWLGKRWEPERLICDPSGPEFKLEGLSLPPDLPPLRLSGRERLLSQLDRHLAAIEDSGALKDYDTHRQNVFGLLRGGKAHEAFDISREPRKVRERYGRGKWGQCVLLARRLIEAGARLVHVNWPREGGDSAVDNPMWDTHAQNADRVQDVLCPQLDISLTALVNDLHERGLLSETLVVAIGEFGRTPRINAAAGRDHWGHVFSFAMAGAGIRTAQVVGSSDKQGAYPHTDRLEPQDLTATIFHLLGIPHDAAYPNIAGTGRNVHITEGQPIDALLGSRPATDRRVEPTGNIALVPEPDDAPLLNVGFEDSAPLQLAGSGKRLKGWQATPLGDPARGFDWGAAMVRGAGARTGKAHLVLGCLPAAGARATVAAGASILLAQEIRNFRAGHYTFSLHACGGGSSKQVFEDIFRKHFTCRLVIYRHTEPTKSPLKRQEVVALPLQPEFSEGDTPHYRKFTLAQLLDSRVPNVNFTVGLGLGVAVLVEKTTPGNLEIPAGKQAFLRIDDVELIFNPRQRNDDVQV